MRENVEPLAENVTSAKSQPMDRNVSLMRGFAICTAPRSGSNFLSQSLSSTGRLGRPLEYFNGPGRRYFDDPDYPDDRGMQIDKILTMGATPNGIYGLKIFAHQHDWIEGQTQWTSKLPNLRFIFLRRRDMLGQAISWARALQTGAYRHGQAPTGEAEFDGEAILGRLRAIATEYARWETYFARNEIEALRFVYEEIVDAPQQAIDKVAGLFDLHHVHVDPRQVDVVVQRDEITESWRKRFAEEFGDPNSVDTLDGRGAERPGLPARTVHPEGACPSMVLEQPLTVLIANIYLTGRSGTEIVTRELAFALMRAGHRPIVYALGLGPIAEEIRARGIAVTDDISTITADIDIIHGNHTQVTAVATARFPNAPVLYFAHDFVAWHSAPPLLATVRKYVAVDDTVAERLQFEAGIATDRIVTLLNAVDTDRFVPGPPLPERPRRALAFAKNAEHLQAVRAACAERGIELDVIGASIGSIVSEPETLLPQYDLVFASALSALEAMACGRAVIVCDGRGLAGMARSDNWDMWRRRNFGLRVLQRPLSPETIAAEIDRYDAADAAEISRRTRQEANMSKWLDACLSLYAEAISQHSAAPPAVAALNLSLARHMQIWMPTPGPIWPWMTEREDLLAQLARMQAELERAELMKAQAEQAEPDFVELEPVEAGKPISFAQADDPERFMRLTGFSAIEHWGVWTDGDLATVEFKISSAAVPTSIRLALVPFLHKHHAKVDAELFINGMRIERRVFKPTDSSAPLFVQQDWQVAFPPKAMLDRTLTIGLRIENPISPLRLGLSSDERRLGLGLCLIELKA